MALDLLTHLVWICAFILSAVSYFRDGSFGWGAVMLIGVALNTLDFIGHVIVESR